MAFNGFQIGGSYGAPWLSSAQPVVVSDPIRRAALSLRTSHTAVMFRESSTALALRANRTLLTTEDH